MTHLYQFSGKMGDVCVNTSGVAVIVWRDKPYLHSSSPLLADGEERFDLGRERLVILTDYVILHPPASFIVCLLNWRRLHEIGSRSDQCPTELAIQAQFAAPDCVDHNTC